MEAVNTRRRRHENEDGMSKIKIVITRTDILPYTERKQFLVKETPSEVMEEETSYGGSSSRKKVTYIKEYENRDVAMERSVERILLTQELDDSEFSLKEVIAAVNQLYGAKA